ncbi:MAG: cbb3-type cytochrome c oxidase subunit I [Planctomycetota bacterium]
MSHALSPDLNDAEPASAHAHAAAHAHEHHGWFRTYIISTDHKMIAKQYMLLGLFFMLFAGLLAMMIRAKLAWPESAFPLVGHLFWPGDGKMPADFYNALFTNHGAIMVFFAITPIVVGMFSNFAVPLQVGARDMIFPWLNMLSFWTLFAGGVVLVLSFFMPQGAAGGGWTMYAPLTSSTTVTSPLSGNSESLFVLAIAFVGTSSLMGAINVIATVINSRCRGMHLMRLPLATWGLFCTSVLNLLWVPVVAVALFMILLDRNFGTNFFNPAKGGQVLLYQHLFWGFGHPEVYILIFPVWGLVGDLLSVFSRKPAFGYKATVFSMFAIVCLSEIVWGHHMFTSGMNPFLGNAFVLVTIAISVPTAIFFFNWLATLWRGSLHFTPPMLYCLGIIFVFAIGGLTGIFNALQALDINLHDTYFIVGHFHYTMAASVLFGAFAGIHYWFPKLFGRRMNDGLATLHFFLTFIFLNIVFSGMLWTGLGGEPRRLADPSTYHFLDRFQFDDVVIFWAAIGMGLTQLLFAGNFLFSMFWGRKAEDNPWHAGSLEWATSTPPPHGNFAAEPVVVCGPHEFSAPGHGDRDFQLQWDPATAAAAATLAPHPTDEVSGVEKYKLGVWIFLASEVMFFTALIGGYLVLRLGSNNWPDPKTILNIPALAVNTFILICSSETMVLGQQAVQAGKPRRGALFLSITALCGLVFVAIKVIDYTFLWHDGFTLSSSLFGSCYYTLTGFHGLHVLTGVVILTVMIVKLLRSKPGSHLAAVESAGLYWYFVDLVWFLLFAVLCLV